MEIWTFVVFYIFKKLNVLMCNTTWNICSVKKVCAPPTVRIGSEKWILGLFLVFALSGIGYANAIRNMEYMFL